MEELITNNKKLRELIIKKIKIEENPEIKKYLKDFFKNPKLYFNNKFKNKIVRLGKINSLMENYHIPVPKKFKRINRRGKTKTFGTIKKSITEQFSLFKEKIKGIKGDFSSSSLKEGQGYINDREIEDIFKTFKNNQEINKAKINDFITFKELSQ